MSLYLFEHDVVYQIIFVVFFVIIAGLLVISGIEIYRSKYASKSRRKLNKVRYITGWCLLIQCATFIGHYFHLMILSAILWNIWIPSWCMGYILLSYNLSEIRIPSKANIIANALKEKSRKQMIIWKIVCCLWFGCTISNWTGSLYGWFLHHLDEAYHIQAYCYLLWKVIAFFMLILCVSILFNIKSTISTTLALFKPPDLTTHSDTTHSVPSSKTPDFVANASSGRIETVEEQVSELKRALNKIKALILCEVALSLFFMVAVVYESYVIYMIHFGEYVTNIYAESTVMSMVCYFPLWTLIHAVLLIYGWIPAEPTIPPIVRDLVDYITETPESRETAGTTGTAPTDNTMGTSTIHLAMEMTVDPESSPIPTLQDLPESNTVVTIHQEMTAVCIEVGDGSTLDVTSTVTSRDSVRDVAGDRMERQLMTQLDDVDEDNLDENGYELTQITQSRQCSVAGTVETLERAETIETLETVETLENTVESR